MKAIASNALKLKKLQEPWTNRLIMDRFDFSRHKKEKGPTQRQLRVGEEIRHILARMLTREDFHNEILQATHVTVTEVRVSPDLKYAKAYVMPIGGKDLEKVIKTLNEYASAFRAELKQQLTIKYIPTLAFRPDKSFDEAERIATLLRSEKVSQDLHPPSSHSDKKDDRH